jgi:hypothetical protein
MTTTPVRPTRRAVVHGAAWSVPVVAVAAAAPAFAASPCVTDYNYRLVWGTTRYERYSHTSGKAFVPVLEGAGASDVEVTLSSTWVRDGNGNANDRRDPAANLSVSSQNVGGTGGRGLYLRHESPVSDARSRRQELTLTFSRPVTGLNFTITDIDSERAYNYFAGRWEGYYDRVELTPTPSTRTPVSTVTGLGTFESPWRQTSNDATWEPGSSNGNVLVRYTGAVSSVKVIFWSAQAHGQQAIYLSNLNFTAKGC